MANARTDFGLKVVGTKIYAISSMSGTAIGMVEEYDTTTDTWSNKASMPVATNTTEFATVNGKIYAIGGESNAINTLQEYDPKTDEWGLKAPMNFARNYHSIAVIGDKIYAIGGNYQATTDEYDTITNTWKQIASLNAARFDAEATVLNNKMYLLGGSEMNNIYYSKLVSEYTLTEVTIPNSPTNLIATAGNSKVDLSWNPVEGASGYNIYRSTSSGTGYTKIGSNTTSSAITYEDKPLTNGITYYYVVTAIVNGVESENSNEASATPTAPVVTGNPGILEITMVTCEIKEYDLTASEIQSFLTWYDVCSNGVDEAYYMMIKKNNIKLFLCRKEYISFDKISSFEVKEYTE